MDHSYRHWLVASTIGSIFDIVNHVENMEWTAARTALLRPRVVRGLLLCELGVGTGRELGLE